MPEMHDFRPQIRFGAVPTDLRSKFTDRSQFLTCVMNVLEDGRTGLRTGKHVDPVRSKALPPEQMLEDGWRYRVRPLPFNVQSLLRADVTVGAVEDMVAAAVHQAKSEIQAQQPNGEWVLAAWELREIMLERRARTPNERQAAWNMHSISDPNTAVTGGGDKPMRFEDVMVREPQVLIDTAWIDFARGGEQDDLDLRYNRKDGTLSRAGEGVVPAFLRKEYEQARAVIARFYRQRGTEVEVDEDAMSDVDFDRCKVLLERGAPWPAIAVVFGQDEEVLRAKYEAKLQPAAPRDLSLPHLSDEASVRRWLSQFAGMTELREVADANGVRRMRSLQEQQEAIVMKWREGLE